MGVKYSKLLIKMGNNPNGDWSIGDIETAAKSVPGVVVKPPGRGSHYKVAHPQVPEILTIPAKKRIKPFYIKEFVSMMDSIITVQEQAEIAKATLRKTKGEVA
jgi:hypothetical protein